MPTHLRTHNGDQKYPCPHCAKRFMRSDHLNKHIKIHQKDDSGSPKCDIDVGMEILDIIKTPLSPPTNTLTLNRFSMITIYYVYLPNQALSSSRSICNIFYSSYPPCQIQASPFNLVLSMSCNHSLS